MLRKSVDKLVHELQVDSYSGHVRSCTSLDRAIWLHRKISRENHCRKNIYLSNLLVQMYTRCGSLERARVVFDGMRHRNIFTWNIMIHAYAQLGHPIQAMQLYKRMDVPANEFTFTTLFLVCSTLGILEVGQQIHRHMMLLGIHPCGFLQSILVNMYAKCGRVDIARDVFNTIADKTLASWNTMISGYAQKGYTKEAIRLFENMDLPPNNITFVSVISACTNLNMLRWIHEKVVKQGMETGVVVATSLVNMYARCGSLLHAKKVFDQMLERNVVTWNAMVSAYAQSGNSHRAMELLRMMDLEGIRPDEVTFSTLLTACWSLSFRQGSMLHAEAAQCGCENSMVVRTALVSMYARCGRLDVARGMFEGMKGDRDVTAWNSIIAGCAQHGEPREALEFYRNMDVKPDRATVTSVLSACSAIGALDVGNEVRYRIRESNQELEKDLSVQNAVLNMYYKCGSLEFAKSFFDEMPERNVVTMNVMMTAYTQQGFGHEAIRLFREMDVQGMPPDEISFASVLRACSYVRDLIVGKAIHARFLTKGCSNMVVETAVVNLYGKCGTLEEAKDVFHSMRHKNTLSWNAILAACAHQGNGHEAMELSRQSSIEGYDLDASSFVSILIACGRSGLLADACENYVVMHSDWQIVPVAEHYHCLIDIFGRAGRLRDAEGLINSMPFQPDAVSWRTLLGSCRTQGGTDTAPRAAELAFDLDSDNMSPYILLSDIYRWEEAGEQLQT